MVLVVLGTVRAYLAEFQPFIFFHFALAGRNCRFCMMGTSKVKIFVKKDQESLRQGFFFADHLLTGPL